ncbi:MAG: iron uptake porin [Cyanomargarita calcarea GSE-NOS-MK-12-04C]|uniref:Iron uptake porin n=1 Tax=Cyanomargarita calcarea GSE-NOS-MK-12-04C TaxID=2839659 RepID=A0A951QJY5_9CYAN|nr:iron uptake porin [Cyanomargarita calcarea GSE-NOS-MK-12-04C]
MTKVFWNVIKLSPVVVAATFLVASPAFADEANQQVTPVSSLSQEANSMGQVTSVSQFSDVQPTDWAFQALQSLVERYGCIAGYPNGTFRGNRAMTRYEFAAGLNACLDRVNELIATATADLVKKEDLATLQRLQEEFSAELATLRGRVDALEARTAELEANQFSTTTKLVGEAIFNLSQAFGDTRALPSGSTATRTNLDSNTVFSDRVRLSLNTSFTGTDLLQTRLQARNTAQFDGGSTSLTSPRPNITGTNMTRLGFDGDGNNAVSVDNLNYAFNLTSKVRVKIDANNGKLYDNTYTFNPDFSSSGKGSISRYGRFSPIYRQGAGGSGLTVSVNPKGTFGATLAYLVPTGGNNPVSGQGIFNGDNTLFGELAFKPSSALNVGLSYARSYTGGTIGLFQSTGSRLANSPFGAGVRTDSNHYGIQVSVKPSDKLTLGGWAGYSTADAKTGAVRDADFFYWAASLGVQDFGKEGNVLGLIFGQPPKVTGGRGITRESGTSYHLEALYKMQMSDNILITPGLLVIFNPENNNSNSTEYVGTLRTTFSF